MNGAVLRLEADADAIILTHLTDFLANVPNTRRLSLRYERTDCAQSC